MFTRVISRFFGVLVLLSTFAFASRGNPDCLPGVPCLPANLAKIDESEETVAALLMLRIAQKKLPQGICIDYKGNSRFEIGIGTDAFLTGSSDPIDIDNFNIQIDKVKAVLHDIARASGKNSGMEVTVTGYADGQHYKGAYAKGKDLEKSVKDSKTKNANLAESRAIKISRMLNGPYTMLKPQGHESAYLEGEYPEFDKGLKCDPRRKVVVSTQLRPLEFEKTEKGGVFRPENAGLSGVEMKPIYTALEADVSEAMKSSSGDANDILKTMIGKGKMSAACANDPVLSRVTRAAIRMAKYRMEHQDLHWGTDLQEKQREFICDEFGGAKGGTSEENELFYKFMVDRYNNPNSKDPAADAKKFICGERGKGRGVEREYYSSVIIKKGPVTETESSGSIEGKFDSDGKLIPGTLKVETKTTTKEIAPGTEKKTELGENYEVPGSKKPVIDPLTAEREREQQRTGIMYKDFDGEGTTLLWCYKGHNANPEQKNLMGNSISGSSLLKENLGEKDGVQFNEETEFDIEFDPALMTVHHGIGVDDPQGYNKNGNKGVSRRGNVCKACGHGRDFGYLQHGKRTFDDRLAANGYGDEMMKKSDALFASDPDSLGAAADPVTFVISDCKDCKCDVYARIRSKSGYQAIRPDSEHMHVKKKFKKKDLINSCVYVQKVAGACTIGPAYNQLGGDVRGVQKMQFLDPVDGIVKQFDDVAHVVEYFTTGKYTGSGCKDCGYDKPKNFQQQINSIACSADKKTKLPSGTGKDAEVADCQTEIEGRAKAEAVK